MALHKFVVQLGGSYGSTRRRRWDRVLNFATSIHD
jgi:hypothetical protein